MLEEKPKEININIFEEDDEEETTILEKIGITIGIIIYSRKYPTTGSIPDDEIYFSKSGNCRSNPASPTNVDERRKTYENIQKKKKQKNKISII